MKFAISILIFVSLVASAVHMSEKKGDDPKLSRSENARRRTTAKLGRILDAKQLTHGNEIFIRIFKEPKQLEMFLRDSATGKFELLKTYKICTYSGELGPKQARGDLQAPEGFYSVARSGMNPESNFHLSFDLGYPNAYDRAHGRSGDYLMVHGNCVSTGCYAMTDPRIEEIFTLADAALSNGQKFFRVHCFPFRMTAERMASAIDAGSAWIPFWQNLKEGYDLFERERVPPDASVQGKKYKFLSGIE